MSIGSKGLNMGAVSGLEESDIAAMVQSVKAHAYNDYGDLNILMLSGSLIAFVSVFVLWQ